MATRNIRITKDSFSLCSDLDWNQVVFPCYVEPKIDGVRCAVYCDANGTVHAFTRTGRELTTFANAPCFAELSAIQNVVFDGELTVGDSWNDTASAIKKRQLTNEELKSARFVAFDIMNDGAEDYVQRRDALIGFSEMGIFEILTVTYCKNRTEIVEAFACEVAAGFEGIVVKDPAAKYIAGRSCAFMKLKPQATTDVFKDGQCFEMLNGRVFRVRDDKVD